MFKKSQKEEEKTKPVKLSAMDEDIVTLLMGRELYGLEILDRLNPDRPIPLSFGSLYPALNRLEKKGLIKWRWGDESEETGGARRKYYRVTGLGATTLHNVQRYRVLLVQRSGETVLRGI
ncbi:MAG: PadR family transcriptional regulator [Symploca sp. SIO1B1]|nr:PadR family transcriptional regulator [Symploca sp. SIO1C2]NER95336.1 PadR family transcriptional regulator [Symploca sp. SIO1B1]